MWSSTVRPEQKKQILPGCTTGDIIMAIGMTEPDCGSDLAALRTTALKDGEDYVINGQKTFITNGINCDWVVLAVKTEPAADPPHKGISLLLVPADATGFSKGRKLRKMGVTLPGYGGNCFLMSAGSRNATCWEKKVRGSVISCKTFNANDWFSPSDPSPLRKKYLRSHLEYARSRTAFGKPISSFQHNAFKLVEMAD